MTFIRTVLTLALVCGNVAAYTDCTAKTDRSTRDTREKAARVRSRESDASRMLPSFDLALQASGQAYLDLELDLRRSSQLDASLTEWLKKQQQAHADPLARLLAAVLIRWTGPAAEDYKKALEYLEFLPVKLARTAVGVPDGQGAENYLTLHFAGRLTELLALRLLKEPEWQHWKRCAAIFYLQQHKLPATTFALIRFAIETATDEQRELAVDAIRESADPELGAKLAFEIARARKLGRRIPADIAALGG